MGSSSKNKDVNSKKKSRNWKKTKSWRVKGPNPQIWWIRIKPTLQERWIDPDPSGSWSTLKIEGTWTGSWVDPTQNTYKGEKTRFHSFFPFSSPSLLRRFSLLQTLNLNWPETTWIRSNLPQSPCFITLNSSPLPETLCETQIDVNLEEICLRFHCFGSFFCLNLFWMKNFVNSWIYSGVYSL